HGQLDGDVVDDDGAPVRLGDALGADADGGSRPGRIGRRSAAGGGLALHLALGRGHVRFLRARWISRAMKATPPTSSMTTDSVVVTSRMRSSRNWPPTRQMTAVRPAMGSTTACRWVPASW